MNLDEIILPFYNKWDKVPNVIETHCSQFIADIMRSLDYNNFNGKTANGIIEIMYYDKLWQNILPEDWNQNSIVIAGLKGEPHGHVCILLQGDFEDSRHWKKQAPLCANIGKTNFWAKGTNYAFHDEPVYYLYKNKIT